MKKPRRIDDRPSGENCGGCPYRATSRGCVKPNLRDSDLAILTGHSSYWDIFNGMPLSDGYGAQLAVFLQQSDFDRVSASIVPAIRCRPIQHIMCPNCAGSGSEQIGMSIEETEFGQLETPEYVDCKECVNGIQFLEANDGDDKTQDPPELGQVVECMKRYGHADLMSLKKKRLILGLGREALYALNGHVNISDYRGSVIESEHGPAFMTYHPRHLNKLPAEEPNVQRDFSRIRGVLSGSEGATLKLDYKVTLTEKEYDGIRGEKNPVIDLETIGGLDPLNGGSILLAGFSRAIGEGYVLEKGEHLREVMETAESVIGQYFYAFDAWMLAHHGYRIPPKIIDTQVLGHLHNPGSPNDLYTLQSVYARVPMPAYWKEREHYENKAQVAVMDVDATKRTEEGLEEALRRDGQWELAERLIIPWTELAFRLRWRGIRVDTPLMVESAERIHEGVVRHGAEFAESFGLSIPKKSKTGIPSPQAVSKHLYRTLKLPVQYHRKTGLPTADAKALRKLRTWCIKNDHVEGKAFLEGLNGRPREDGEWELGLKQLSTQVKDFRKYARQGSGRIHAQPNVTGTETGRLSYINPNLQQVPPIVKPCFLPEVGHILLQFDYKQIEFLVMLYHAGEWDLLREALGGRDFHKLCAALFHNKHVDAVTKKERTAIKPINLGRLYGKGVWSTAIDLEKTKKDVEEIYTAYDKMMPGLSQFQQRELQLVKSLGYIHTEFGWRRRFPRGDRANAHRSSVATKAYNTRIQSNAGLTTRETILNLDRQLSARFGDDTARVLLTVHDSGLISCEPDVAWEVADAIRDIACGATRPLPCPELGMPDGLRFPIDLEWSSTNWGCMKPFETFNDKTYS